MKHLGELFKRHFILEALIKLDRPVFIFHSGAVVSAAALRFSREFAGGIRFFIPAPEICQRHADSRGDLRLGEPVFVLTEELEAKFLGEFR